MGLLARIITRMAEPNNKRQLNPADDRYYTPQVIASMTDSGIEVSASNAMKLSTVLSCSRVLSESFACLPIHLYKKVSKGKHEKDTRHYLANLLKNKPNKWQTGFEFWEMVILHLIQAGNFYAQKITSFDGSTITELIPLDPQRMKVIKLNTGFLVYEYRLLNGNAVFLPQNEVFHIKGMSTDGITGMSLIKWASETMGAAIAAKKYGAKFFNNDATPGVVLQHPAKLSDPVYARLQRSWENAHRGADNAHKVAILEEGITANKIGISPEDAQLLSTNQYLREELCGIYRVPLWLIQVIESGGDIDLESRGTTFVRWSLMPWVKRIEAAIESRLMSEEESSGRYVEFNLDGLMRGDLESRYKAYAIGRQWGWLSPDRICEKENMEPIGEGGDVFLVPMNMVDAKYATELKPKPVGTNNEAQNNPNAPTNENQNQIASVREIEAIQNCFITVFGEKLRSLFNKEEKRVASLKSKPENELAIAQFYAQHREFMKENLFPLIKSYTELRNNYAARKLNESEIETTSKQAAHIFASDYEEARRINLDANKEIIGRPEIIIDNVEKSFRNEN